MMIAVVGVAQADERHVSNFAAFEASCASIRGRGKFLQFSVVRVKFSKFCVVRFKMADESINIPLESQNLDYHIVTLLEKIENLRIESYNVRERRLPCQVEIRTIEFWKSVICECLASFIYVFIVCGAAAGAGAGASLSSVMLATALSAGFTMATLNQCFGHISGKF